MAKQKAKKKAAKKQSAKKATKKTVRKYRVIGRGKNAKKVLVGSTADYRERGLKAARTRKKNLKNK